MQCAAYTYIAILTLSIILTEERVLGLTLLNDKEIDRLWPSLGTLF
ncbi:MAG: hypothetical protein AB4426_19990 [Xenococcaceae cyanobacterium]